MEHFRIATLASTLFTHVRISSLPVIYVVFPFVCFSLFGQGVGGYFARTIQGLLRIGNETAIGPGNRGSHLSGLFVRLGLHSYTHGRLTAWSDERSTNAFIIQKFRTLRALIISELSQTGCFSGLHTPMDAKARRTRRQKLWQDHHSKVNLIR